MSLGCGLTDAAKRTGLTTNQVRNYLQFRLINSTWRSARGHYQFDQAALKRLRLIGLGARAGMRLESIRRFLDAMDDSDQAVLTVERERVERFIDERRSTLRQLVREVHRACEAPKDYGALRPQRTQAQK